LRREVFAHVVRIRPAEASRNLLGRPARHPLRPDILPQPRVVEFPYSPGVMGADSRVALRRTGAIGMTSWGGPGHLAAHGARCTPQYPRHRSKRMAVCQAQT